MFFKWLWRKAGNLVMTMLGRARAEGSDDTSIVVVGLEKSSRYGGCPGSRVDSEAMRKALSGKGGMTVLQDKSATVGAVSGALSRALASKLCIFYYSGHGGRGADPKGEGGMSEFLCLEDGPLHDYDIWRMIQSACPGGRVVMVFDCCHSATMFREASTGDAAWFRNTGFRFGLASSASTARAQGREGMNLLVWSGCPADDYSYGGEDGGVLTNGIRRGLAEPAPTYDSVWERARRFAEAQKPERTVIGTGFSGSVFR